MNYQIDKPDNILYVISFYEDDEKDFDYENEEDAWQQAANLILQKTPIQLTEVNYTRQTQKILLSYGFEKIKKEVN